jgi:hypothetical protein
MPITTGTRTVGPSTEVSSLPVVSTRQKLYISDYTAVSNALVVGDLVTGVVNPEDIRLQSTGAATQVVTLDGNTIAQPGETTYSPLTVRMKSASSDPKVQVMLLASDGSKRGVDRVVNVNIENFDTSLDKFFAVVLSANAIQGSNNDLDAWEFQLQPFGVQRVIVPTS